MKNLIFASYANIPNHESSPNLASNSSETNSSIYLECAFVSLYSAKIKNPDDVVALITNVDLNKFYINLFTKNNIKIHKIDFDSFKFEKNYRWNLAFYKLCALKYCVSLNYDKYISLDLDTYTQLNYKDIWEEVKSKILLLDINHSLSNQDCLKFNNEIKEFLNIDSYLTNYGGEFIAGNSVNLKQFVRNCEKVYNLMLKNNFKTNFGDEFIIRIVAEKMNYKIKNAAAYIFRYWTNDFYLVSTNYLYNPVAILHCPNEKSNGFRLIFKNLIRNRRFNPHKLLNLQTMPIKYRFKKFIQLIFASINIK